ncbi:type IV pilus assembly protein PilW [Natronospira proteinivora]|uniref:Type IV pilus assembly protein PilW n=1 Tax=Natronospira proteinivora TaxID=1807133 RepID=A0ABT1G4Q4_9GAMM|nr:PilW family protein [Natronospira proteinivora]MCP1726272.1 type IV pilus assembly protein PilW [Natronospira proteinivora]
MQQNFNRERRPARKAQSGLTLVELMIAVAIGSVLMIGVIQLFSGMRGAYSLNESMSRVQENGRFAIEYLSSDLRMAGYMGCMSNSGQMDFYAHNLDEDSDFLTNFAEGLRGYEARGTAPDDDVTIEVLNPDTSTNLGAWNPALPAELSDSVVEGTDVVVIRYMDSDGVNLVPPVTTGSQWHTDGADDDNYAQDSLLLTTDCAGRAVLFRRNNSSNSTNVQPSGSLPFEYRNMGEEGEIARAIQAAYYIGIPDSTGVPTLMRQVIDDTNGSGLNTEAVELVPGVEQMQILYGVDTSGTKDASGHFSVDRYVTADQVTAVADWNNVRAVRLSLLVRSEANLSDVDDPVRDFSLQRTNVEVDIQDELDRRNRRTFNTTVHLRNR